MDSESGIQINSNQCLRIASKLQEMPVRPGFTGRPFLKYPLDTETRLSMLFYAVAICHQTRYLKSEKHQLSGWEYIEKVLLELAIAHSYLLDSEKLANADSLKIASDLASAFSDNGNPDQTTLDSIAERVLLMKDTSQLVNSRFDGSFIALTGNTGGFLLHNGEGLYELLSNSLTFSDPFRKKSSFLAKLMIDAGLFVVNDRENYIPIMDYHMQRVLLRLGCVEVISTELHKLLSARTPVSTDEPVRLACIGAVTLISEYSGIDLWQMNDYFWTLGRSCCNETTLCSDGFCSKNPCTFQSVISIPAHRHCSFEYICTGFNDIQTRSLWEPMVQTHYY